MVDSHTATILLQRWFDPARRVTDVRLLSGGMVHRVCYWRTDAPDDARCELVVKLNQRDHYMGFQRERDHLRWYRQHTNLPVPEPIVAFDDADAEVSGLIMTYVPGINLAEATLSDTGIRRLQRAFAEHIADLHSHTRDYFGPALGVEDAGRTRWVDAFAPSLEREFRAVRDQLSSRNRMTIDALLRDLDHWLPDQATPTLVHGDLWSTNILVDDRHPDHPHLLAFVDVHAAYCDPEYELAYLRLFHTADDTFFHAYRKHHALRDGFDRRCRVYWLNTMLLHVRRFGEHYLPACEKIGAQLRRIM